MAAAVVEARRAARAPRTKSPLRISAGRIGGGPAPPAPAVDCGRLEADAAGTGLDPGTTSSSRVRSATVSDPPVTLTRAWPAPGGSPVRWAPKGARREK